MNLTPGQILTPLQMPNRLRARYYLKLKKFKVTSKPQGVRYEGIQQVPTPWGAPLHLFTILDEGAQSTLGMRF